MILSMHCELLIDGVFYGGPCDSSIGKTQHYAPYDGKLVGTAAEAGWSELSAALNAASEAFQTWRFSPISQRQQLLRTIANSVRERSDELSGLMAVEIGKPLLYAKAEVTRLAVTFELAASVLDEPLCRTIDTGTDERGNNYEVTATRVPRGVIFAVVPYNWPYNLAAHKIAPAIAAGNTVVVKTPSMGTLCTLTLARIINEAGCPDGVVNVLNAPSALAEKAILDPRTTMLSFTGSPKVGWMLKEKLPRKPVALELGGDATAVVAQDADIERAVAQLVSSSFAYAGQVCISTQHIVVQNSVYEEFKQHFVEATLNCKFGDPLEDGVVCGPVINEDSADRIMDWIDEAEQAGGTVHGGSRIGRNLIQPCVVESVDRSVKLGYEEVFGPVVTLNRYTKDQDAIDWINASQFGIHASVFTNDPTRQNLFYQHVETGGVIINDSPSVRFDAMPYGGAKNSGFGREGVHNTFHEMTEDKTQVQHKK